jgi:hypothetical protein
MTHSAIAFGTNDPPLASSGKDRQAIAEPSPSRLTQVICRITSKLVRTL